MKFWNYVVILTAMIIFLEFTGVPTGLSSILNTIGININQNTSELISADIANSGFYSQVFGSGVGLLAILIASGVGIVIVGLFAKSYDVSLIVAPFIVFVGGLYISTFWTLILYVQNISGQQGWIVALITTILAPLGIGFVISCVDYFKGSSD